MDDNDVPPVIFPSDSTGDPKACKDIRPRIAKHMANNFTTSAIFSSCIDTPRRILKCKKYV